jgi:predicted 3-demethylubiquinone-9 3-methyltransferase (glyoxalase superfamily)
LLDRAAQTRYTARVRHWSKEDYDTHTKMGFHDGWGQCADQLAALAKTLSIKSNHSEDAMMAIKHTIVPHLWFDGDAEEAVKFYVSLFDNSRIIKLSRYTEAGPGPKGSVMSIEFLLNGQEFAALNGGPHFKFNEAVSFLIWCDTQSEIDALYSALIEDGQAQACGWLKDRFGLVWQANYARLPELLTDADAAAAKRTMQAMMTMKKIDVQLIEDAYSGKK